MTSWSQLDAAELAVRAIILHRRLYWLLPALLIVSPESTVKGNSPPVVQDGGHVVYPRYKEPQAVMDVLRQSGASSYSVYSTWLYVRNNTPVEGHEFWIKNYDRLKSSDVTVVEQVFRESFQVDYFRNSYYASPKAIGAGSYFGDSGDRNYEAELMQNHISALPEKALKLLDDEWIDSVSGEGVGLNVRLGPFLAIVLSRAGSRKEIPRVVMELREEFQESREEFWHLFTDPLTEKRAVVATRKLRNLERAGEGMIRGVPAGNYTQSIDNRQYALDAVNLLRVRPELSNDLSGLWEEVMTGRIKQHNEQMSVVVALWKNGDIHI